MYARALLTPCACLRKNGRCSNKGWSCAPYTQQRSLHYILAQCPTTAGSAQFCLLCCQPEPVPGSSTARVSQLTPWNPCRLPAWSGRTINMRYRTCCAPVHFITQPPLGNRRLDTPSGRNYICHCLNNMVHCYACLLRASRSLVCKKLTAP